MKSKDIRNQPQRFKTLGLTVSVGQEIEAVEASRPAELIASLALQNKAVVYDILFRPAADTGADRGERAPGPAERSPAGRRPSGLGRQPVARHDAINIRVMGEVLPPGVQHRGHADLRPEMLGIGRRLIARIKPIVPTAPTC